MAGGVLAATLFAAGQETLEQLQARAAQVKPAEQVRLYLEVAERQWHAAEEAYGRDDVERGNARVDEMATACEKAAEAARDSGKHLKFAEIRLRSLERRLENVRRQLNFDDREAATRAIERLEKARTTLFRAMFGMTP